MPNEKKSSEFEKSMKELEKIVLGLESGQTNLDESLKMFEKGVEIYKKCKTTLVNAEKKIKILTEELNEEDFE